MGSRSKDGQIDMRDVGQFQINLWVHGSELQRLGLDVIHSADDNAKYALMLYKESGTQPWSASENCWKNF
jgi:hypothetical protein